MTGRAPSSSRDRDNRPRRFTCSSGSSNRILPTSTRATGSHGSSFGWEGEPIRIAFDPNPLAWTQAPEDRRSLRAQRCRWRRGLLQVLWRHRRMIGNRRFGIVALGTLPYILFFEGLGPLLEIGGYGVTAARTGAVRRRRMGRDEAPDVRLGGLQ
jgi:hypothetical protein